MIKDHSIVFIVNIVQFFLIYSFGILHIGQLGSIAVTVSIATERYITVCYPTSHFSRKYLLILLPIIISLIYNIPKFFEIVKCSDKEMYATMLKSYYENEVNNTVLTKKGEDTLTIQAANEMNQSYPITNQTYVIFNNASETDSQYDEHVHQDKFDKETRVENEMNKFLMTTNHKQVVDALNEDIPVCDVFGHRVASFRNNRWYIILYHFFSDLFLVKILPWIAVIVFNAKVFIASRRFRQTRRRLLNKTEDERGRSSHRIKQLQIIVED